MSLHTCTQSPQPPGNAYTIKKGPSSRISQMFPKGYSPRRRSPQTPRYHFLLPVFTSHLSPILRLSVQTNRLPFNGGIPVCLTGSFLFSYRLLAGDIFSVALLSLTNRKLSAMRRYSERHCPVLRIWMSNSWIVVIIVLFFHLSIPSFYIFFIISISNFYKIYSCRF